MVGAALGASGSTVWRLLRGYVGVATALLLLTVPISSILVASLLHRASTVTALDVGINSLLLGVEGGLLMLLMTAIGPLMLLLVPLRTVLLMLLLILAARGSPVYNGLS